MRICGRFRILMITFRVEWHICFITITYNVLFFDWVRELVEQILHAICWFKSLRFDVKNEILNEFHHWI